MHFFIMISLLLHVLSVIAIIVLFQKKSLEPTVPLKSEEELDSINKSIQSFIQEVERENEALYERLLRHMYRKEQDWNSRMKQIERRLPELKGSFTSLEKEKEQSQESNNNDPGLDRYQTYRREVQGKKAAPVHQAESLTKRENNQRVVEDKTKVSSPNNAQDEDDHIQKVYELHNQGFSKEHISKVLKLGMGEVSFIVNMLEKYRQKGRS